MKEIRSIQRFHRLAPEAQCWLAQRFNVGIQAQESTRSPGGGGAKRRQRSGLPYHAIALKVRGAVLPSVPGCAYRALSANQILRSIMLWERFGNVLELLLFLSG